jgi:hypothetical protein
LDWRYRRPGGVIAAANDAISAHFEQRSLPAAGRSRQALTRSHSHVRVEVSYLASVEAVRALLRDADDGLPIIVHVHAHELQHPICLLEIGAEAIRSG